MTTSDAIVYVVRLAVAIRYDDDHHIVEVDVADLLSLLGTPGLN